MGFATTRFVQLHVSARSPACSGIRFPWRPSHPLHPSPALAFRYATQKSSCGKTGSLDALERPHATPPISTLPFWTSRPTWRRAAINTFRCLVGCTSGDFAAMWFLQAHYPNLGVGGIMAISMASGLTTSMLLETVLLRLGRDGLSWPMAARTAAGMSLVSMLAMEAAENAVDYHLTGGVVAVNSSAFWTAAGVAMVAGFVTPLPYNYVRLRKYGKACH